MPADGATFGRHDRLLPRRDRRAGRRREPSQKSRTAVDASKKSRTAVDATLNTGERGRTYGAGAMTASPHGLDGLGGAFNPVQSKRSLNHAGHRSKEVLPLRDRRGRLREYPLVTSGPIAQ